MYEKGGIGMEKTYEYIVTRNNITYEVKGRDRSDAINSLYRQLKENNEANMPRNIQIFRTEIQTCVKKNPMRLGKTPPLTKEQKQDVIDSYKAGVSIKDLAEKYGKTKQSIYDLLERAKEREPVSQCVSAWDDKMMDLDTFLCWVRNFKSKCVANGKIGNKKILYYDDKQVVLQGVNYRESHLWKDYYKGAIS